MKHLHSALGASVLALGIAAVAFPATAQTSGNTTTYGKPTPGPATTDSASPGAATQNSPTTGALPDNSLPGQRQGTIGGTVTQGGAQSGSSGSSGGSAGGTSSSSGSSSGTSGALPDNSLPGQRQGAIGGGAVTQGGAGSTEKPKQGSGQ